MKFIIPGEPTGKGRPRVEVEITEVHHEGLFDFVP